VADIYAVRHAVIPTIHMISPITADIAHDPFDLLRWLDTATPP
jgi:hypothetical protein